MSTENAAKPQNTKSSFSFGKLMLYALPGIAIAWLSLMIVFGNFVDINKDLYARTFMVWRNKGGDAALFEGRYKGYKENDYKENKDFSKFLEFAQNKEGYIITGNYPLHAPRGPEKLYTLIDKQRVVEELWKVEFNVKAFLNGKKTDQEKLSWRKEAIQALKDKKYDLNFKTMWFVENPKITPQDIKTAFDNGENIWWKAAPAFMNILNKLADNKKDYKYKDGSVTDELFKDISAFLKPLGYKAEDLKSTINTFFLNMGTVKATPFETFAYSRMFNLYTFLTLNYKFDYKRPIDKGQEKKLNEFHAKEKAEIFALIFSNVYEKPYTYELKNSTWKEKFTAFFGTSQNISDITKDQSDNIKGSLKKAAENLEIETESTKAE